MFTLYSTYHESETFPKNQYFFWKMAKSYLIIFTIFQENGYDLRSFTFVVSIIKFDKQKNFDLKSRSSSISQRVFYIFLHQIEDVKFILSTNKFFFPPYITSVLVNKKNKELICLFYLFSTLIQYWKLFIMLEMKRCFEFGIQWGRTNRRTNDFTINKYFTNSFSHYIKTLK